MKFSLTQMLWHENSDNAVLSLVHRTQTNIIFVRCLRKVNDDQSENKPDFEIGLRCDFH